MEIWLSTRKRGRTMRIRESKENGIRNCILAIALILGVSVTVFVSGVQAQAQNPGSSQMSNMPYDLHFIDMMAMHHRQGIAMGRVAERKGTTPALRAFAKKTADEQEKELLELKKHRDHWYAGAPEMDHSQMMAQMHQSPVCQATQTWTCKVTLPSFRQRRAKHLIACFWT